MSEQPSRTPHYDLLIKTLKDKIKRSPFLRTGCPFVLLILGASYAMSYSTEIRYIHHRNTRSVNWDELRAQGVEVYREKITLEDEYEKLKQTDTSNYKNIRAPRPDEDNEEYLKSIEKRKKLIEERKNRGLLPP